MAHIYLDTQARDDLGGEGFSEVESQSEDDSDTDLDGFLVSDSKSTTEPYISTDAELERVHRRRKKRAEKREKNQGKKQKNTHSQKQNQHTIEPVFPNPSTVLQPASNNKKVESTMPENDDYTDGSQSYSYEETDSEQDSDSVPENTVSTNRNPQASHRTTMNGALPGSGRQSLQVSGLSTIDSFISNLNNSRAGAVGISPPPSSSDENTNEDDVDAEESGRADDERDSSQSDSGEEEDVDPEETTEARRARKLAELRSGRIEEVSRYQINDLHTC